MQLIHSPLSSAFNLVKKAIGSYSDLTSGPREEPQTHELNLDFFFFFFFVTDIAITRIVIFGVIKLHN